MNQPVFLCMRAGEKSGLAKLARFLKSLGMCVGMSWDFSPGNCLAIDCVCAHKKVGARCGYGYASRIVRGCRLFSMTSQQYLCAACPSATKPRERRDLNSEASVRFSSSLATFICEKELTAVWESYQNKRYVCISCVKTIETFSKLQSELRSLETRISDNMKRRAESCTTGARECRKSQIKSRFKINLA